MTTLAARFLYRHTRLRILTEQATEFIDITSGLESLVADAGLRVGLLNVQTLHTTAAIVVNEHEPGLVDDFGAVLASLAPQGAPYRHDGFEHRPAGATPEERPNGHAHCRALVLNPSACLNVADGRLALGRWQRVFLAELDGPRARDLAIVLVGEARRGNRE